MSRLIASDFNTEFYLEIFRFEKRRTRVSIEKEKVETLFERVGRKRFGFVSSEGKIVP